MDNTERRQRDEGYLLLEQKLDQLVKKVDEMSLKLDVHYVTQAEFRPVRTLVYGAVALMLTSVLGALVALVVRGAK